MPFDTLPLVIMPSQRGTGTADGRMVNCIVEPISNPILREISAYCRKRPGLANSTQPSGGAANGRGLYAWQATGKLYSVFGSEIYSATSALSAAMAASSGRVWATETPATASSQLLIFSDGTDNYNITTGDALSQIDETDDAQYPSTNLGPIFYFDGYLVQGSTTYIYNSQLDSFVSWAAADIKPLDRHGDALECLHHQKDQIIAAGKNSIEFFYNAGKPVGSPFQRIEQNTLDFGTATKNSWAWSGSTLLFVGENSSQGDGGRIIWMLQALSNLKDVSTPTVNRILTAEGSSMSSCTAFMERLAGQLIYCINLSSADRSFVFQPDVGLWHEWLSSASAKFPVVSAASLNGTIYGQDATNGRIYTFSDSTYQDSGSAFSMIVQTDPRDQGTSNRKSVEYIELWADTQTSGSTTLEKSDDDGATWQTVGTFDLTAESKRIHRCGSYTGRRAWRLTDSGNNAWRGQALRLKYKVGAH